MIPIKQAEYIKILKKEFSNNKEFNQLKLSKYLNVSANLVSQWMTLKKEIPENYHEPISKYFDKPTEFIFGLNSLQKDILIKKQKYELIHEDITSQIEEQGKYGKHYDDLVDHAVYLFKLKDQLQEDIEKHGLRITLEAGNGYKKTSDNASVKNINQVSTQLIKVLKEIGINETNIKEESYDEDEL